MDKPIKQSVEDWVAQVDYTINPDYIPSEFALAFVNFIKLVNGSKGEEHLTPVLHYSILDLITGKKKKIANMLFRGSAKALSLDTEILTPYGHIPMRDIQIGDTVIDRRGEPTKVTHVSSIFTNKTYEIKLTDGSSFIANEDHQHITQRRSTRGLGSKGQKQNSWKEEVLTTKELFEKEKETKWYIPLQPNFHSLSRTRIGIESIEPTKEPVPSKCISVDSPTESYLIENSIITHNTTLTAEYLFLYLALYGEIPGFGKVPLAIYLSDSIDNGVKNLRKNLQYRWENSEFLQQYIPTIKFTDTRWEFINIDKDNFVVKAYGAKALSLNSILYTDNGITTIDQCKVGDRIFGADGELTTITHKSDIFNKTMYQITLQDGRFIRVSEDHINPVVINTNPNNTLRLEEFCLTTKELLERPLIHTKKGNHSHRGTTDKSLIFVKNTDPLKYSTKDLPMDPYTLGVILGDGRIQKPDCSVELTTHIDDLSTYQKYISFVFGKGRFDKRHPQTWTQSIRGVGPILKKMELGVHGSKKFIPEQYLYGSIEQRLALLQGLMDTDGTITETGRTSFCSCSPQLLKDVMQLARSLGGTASTNKKPYCTEIWLNMPVFRLPRKLLRQRYDRKDARVAITSIKKIENEPSQCIAVDNKEHQFLTNDYFRTHNTGVRGTKEKGQRPVLAVLDDLVSDEDARSDTVIASIEDTVYKAVNFALHPSRSKIIWNGTPFNSRDPLYKAIESGAWHSNVFPMCEEFPCSKEEYKSAWPDRFPYEYAQEQYDAFVLLGKIANFNQELMLRIMSDEERLILDSDILWYKYASVREHKGRFNFYITTDFATTAKTSADFSVISVWALNHNGDWFWVDGIVKKQTMDLTVDDLFRLAQKWKPQSVGIEISGQQKGFINWIMSEMLNRNIYFSLASGGNNKEPGLPTNTNKVQKFSTVVPWFKAKKMYFPEEKKNDPELVEAITELSLAAIGKFKSKHDDFIDTISQLAELKTWRPSEETNMHKTEDDIWEEDEEETRTGMAAYIV